MQQIDVKRSRELNSMNEQIVGAQRKTFGEQVFRTGTGLLVMLS